MIYIGIDTGVHTGVAVWDSGLQTFLDIKTMKIHQALDFVRQWARKDEVRVIVEDARQRKWFGERAQYKQQGAGSIKRDASVWEDALTDWMIPFRMVAPMKGGTKWTAEQFKEVTGWCGTTSNHARDASLLVFGR